MDLAIRFAPWHLPLPIARRASWPPPGEILRTIDTDNEEMPRVKDESDDELWTPSPSLSDLDNEGKLAEGKLAEDDEGKLAEDDEGKLAAAHDEGKLADEGTLADDDEGTLAEDDERTHEGARRWEQTKVQGVDWYKNAHGDWKFRGVKRRKWG